MPKAMEASLKMSAKTHHFKKGSKRYNRYVYGTMQEKGLLHSHKHVHIIPRKHK